MLNKPKPCPKCAEQDRILADLRREWDHEWESVLASDSARPSGYYPASMRAATETKRACAANGHK